MSLQQPERGEDWAKPFKKVTVQAGPLKGARYGDISFEDLKKSARSYRSDPRFNQYAKRIISEKALGNAQDSESAKNEKSSTSCRCCSWKRTLEWGTWLLLKSRGRIFLFSLALVVLLLLMSRPLFYVVCAKGLRVVVRLILRRSVGLLVLLIDSILDEAAASIEAGLLTPPSPPETATVADNPVRLEIQQYNAMSLLLMNSLFTLAGILMGRHWRARATAARPPTRLNLV